MRVTSAAGKSMEISLANASTAQEVLDAVSREWGLPAERHQLLFRGKPLSPTAQLRELGVVEDEVLHFRSTLRGGCSAGCHLCGSGAGCRCAIV